MKKVKTLLSLALSALILMPFVTPSAVCTNASRKTTASTRKLGSRDTSLSGRGSAVGKRWVPIFLSSEPARAFQIIDSLSPDMTPDEWNATMEEILDIVWRLNTRRQKYAARRNKKLTTEIHSAVWDILLYLFDHITFDCQVGDGNSKIDYDKISIILYIASGGNIDNATNDPGGELGIMQGIVTDCDIVHWARRPLNEKSREFALRGLNALWYDTAPHRALFESNPLAQKVLETLNTNLVDLSVDAGDKIMSSLKLVGDKYKYSGDQIENSLPSRKHPGEDIYQAYYQINISGFKKSAGGTAPLLEISEDSSDDFSDDSSYYD